MTKRKTDPIDDLAKKIMDYIGSGAPGPTRALQTEYVKNILRLASIQGAEAALTKLQETSATTAPAKKP